MASKVPTVRQINWWSTIPHLMVMFIILYGYYLLGIREFFLWGAITYLVISRGLRWTIARQHAKGMQQVKSGNFEEAIPYFQNSLEYFTQNEWIDRYRFLTVLSSSRLSYRDMALINIAFCHSQLGHGNQAMEFYKKALELNPENNIALTAVRMFESMKSSD